MEEKRQEVALRLIHRTAGILQEALEDGGQLHTGQLLGQTLMVLHQHPEDQETIVDRGETPARQ